MLSSLAMLLLILAALADDADDYATQMRDVPSADPDRDFRTTMTIGAIGGGAGPVGLIGGVYGAALWINGDAFGDASASGTGQAVTIVSGIAILAGAPLCANRGLRGATLVSARGRHTSRGLGYTSYGLAAGGGLSLLVGTASLASASTSGDLGSEVLGVLGLELGLLAETGAYGTCWGQLVVDWVQHARTPQPEGPPLPTASNRPPVIFSLTPVVSRQRSALVLSGSF